ncbi:MAG TPA: HisA/HisF-related TIM barrel protein [Candidatus Acidoferrales bacterium]|jgi:phosphoribosylformimino-5-aminoimidazole carboxamide ribotide isomerase|nr:HisA/HisF-related TIM barrel protein [Candidatus Acidoferrales bacterium]
MAFGRPASDLLVIVPCIDLQDGRAVQLVHGRKLRLAVEDVFGLLERFREYPLLHVIDLDAAMRRGSNSRLVGRLCRKAPMRVRVGGGIRTVARAKRLIAAGAEKVIVGSAAFRDGGIDERFLSSLRRAIGRKRIIVAVDTQGGRILVRGWQEKLRLTPDRVFAQLEPYASEFLCTYVDAEGTMRGTNLRWFRQLRDATRLPITAAGGIRSAHEVRALEQLGMNAAVGMALYLNRLR